MLIIIIIIIAQSLSRAVECHVRRIASYPMIPTPFEYHISVVISS